MSMTMNWTLGEHIAKARKDAGLDQAQLARAVKIARNSLSNYETGRSVPPFDVAVRIAEACGVGLDWFAAAVNAETAPAGAGAVSSLSQHSSSGVNPVRLEGLEPPTFWSVARRALDGIRARRAARRIDAAFWGIVAGVEL